MSVNLETTYLGLKLASPLVASASPLSRTVEMAFRLEEAGAAAIVLPSLFEEQIEHEELQIHEALEYGAESFAEAPGGYLPELAEGYNTGPGPYLNLIKAARAELSVPVIASLNGVTRGGWTAYAARLEEAGASALELNVYFIAADVEETGEQVERRYLDLVEAVRSAVEIPLAVKVGPFFSSMANMARRLVDAGADGLVLFNRFYQPDIDLERLEVAPRVELSTSTELRVPLRWIAILRGRIDASLAATTGVHTAEDVVKLILAGADATMMASALLRQGPGHLSLVRQGVTRWFDEHEYESVEQAKGSLSQKAVPDPSAFERSNYMETLMTYASPAF